ncbi:hypothetical protein BJAS_P3455 [Bathymodiolus japonicus methanotrophic gill symbiont]|uniref:hypothetical protein n=1 Tax=Bathymodiolus japonicus methanotrophic gill symbiont TaxID=113269 RepID=UPI001B59D9EF|nr:hypothetical protein [Bathymodiolus japonicus methanotrophic gill symbiont]GFO72918.1 hypothetical protein BJAS_P3455 [Bathymodiolus japonicus methanotrophic gill symbiont]
MAMNVPEQKPLPHSKLSTHVNKIVSEPENIDQENIEPNPRQSLFPKNSTDNDEAFQEAHESGIKRDLEESTQEEALHQLKNIEDFDPSWLQRRSPDTDFPNNKDAELALKAQVDIRTAQEDPEFATQRALEIENDRKQLSAPVSNAIVRNPQDTGILRPDFDKLDRLYEYLNQNEYLSGDTKDSFTEKVTTAYRKGEAIVNDSYLSNQVRNTLSAGMPITGELKSKLDQSQFQMMAGTSDGSLLSNMAVATSEILPPLIDSALFAGVGAIEGASIGSVVGSAVPILGTASGLGIGAKIGGAIGFAENTFNQTYVPAAYAYSKMKVEGQTLDPQIVNTAATLEALVSSSLDLVPTAFLFSSAKKAAGSFGASNIAREVIESALKTDSGRKILFDAVKDIGKATVSESIVEGSQEVVMTLFGELAKQWTSEKRGGSYDSGDVAEELFSQETFDKAIDASKQAMLATPLLVGVPTVITSTNRAMQLHSRVNHEQQEQQTLDNIIDSVSELESKNTNPGRDVVSDILKESSNDTVYLDTHDVKLVIEELKQDGVTPENSTWLGAINDAIQDAESSGSKIEVPTVTMVDNLKQKGGDKFRNLMALNPDSASPYRRKKLNQEEANLITQELDAAIEEQTRLEDIKVVTDTVLGQLKDTGVLSTNAAKLLSQLIPAWADTMVQGTDTKASTMIEQWGLRIKGAYDGLNESNIDNAQGLYNTATRTITLGNTQDLSTFIHETAHFFFDVEQTLGDVSRIHPMFPAMARDLNISESDISNAIKEPNSNSENYVKVQEYFARKFESYIMKGVAPSLQLRDAFRNWRQWMLFTYSGSNLVNESIDPEIQQVFNSMLAKQQMEKSMVDELMYNDLATQEAGEVTDKADYNRQRAKDRKNAIPLTEEESQTKGIQKIFRILKKRQTKEHKKQQVEAKDQAEKNVDADPMRVLVSKIKQQGIKLNRNEVKDLLGVTKLPSNFTGLTEVNGSSITDIISLLEINGTPEQIVSSISEMNTREKDIKNEAERITLSKDDRLSDEALYAEAANAVRSGEQANKLISKLNDIDGKLGRQKDNRNAIKQAAIDAIYTMRVGDVKTSTFHNREVNAAMSYTGAIKDGSLDFAAHHAKVRLINFFMAKEATKIESDSKSIPKKLSKYKNKKTSAKIVNAGHSFWDRLSVMLARAEIIPEELAADGIKSYSAWLASNEHGKPPQVLWQDKVTPIKDMTVGEMYALNDAALSLIRASQTANDVIVGNEIKDLNEVVSKINAEMDANRGDLNLSSRVGGKDHVVMDSLRSMLSTISITPWIIKTLSNPKGTVQSVMQLVFDKPLVDALRSKNLLWKSHVEPIISNNKYNSKEFVNRMASLHTVNSLAGNEHFNGTMTGDKMLSFVLNLGTQKNMQKLLQGYGIIQKGEVASINHPVVVEIISKLTKTEVEFVQSIWKQMDSLFPKLSAVHKEYKGISLVREEGIEMSTPHGNLMGGYYPLKRNKDVHDTTKTSDTDSLMNEDFNDNLSPSTSSVHERTDSVYAVSLDLEGGIFGHFNKVIQYISHYGAIDSINKIMSDNKFKKTFEKSAGKSELKSLQLWLKEVANPSVPENQNFADKLLKHTRYGMTVAILGGSIFRTAPKQLLGLSAALGDLGHASIINAFKTLATQNSSALIADMKESSAIMRDRIEHNSFDRDLNELKMSVRGQSGHLSKFNDAMMMPIRVIQFYGVDVPVWIAAKQKSFDESMSKGVDADKANKDASIYADSVVERTQGAAGQKNLGSLSRAERNELAKQLTQFMTPMLAMTNNIIDSVRSSRRGSISQGEAVRRMFYVVMYPSLILAVAQQGKDEVDDNDTDIIENIANETLMSITGLVPLVRNAASWVKGYGGGLGSIETLSKGVSSSANLSTELYNRAFDPFEANGEFKEKDIKNIIKFAGIMAHVGATHQITESAFGLGKALDDWDNKTKAQVAKLIMTGK